MPNLFSTEIAVGYARVAVERSVDHYPDGLTYAIPPELSDLRPGERVIVPLGRGNTPTAGFVVERMAAADLEPDAVKFIKSRDLGGVRLTNDLLELARWISSYYCAPIGMTLATMLPAAVKKNIGTVRKTMVNLIDDLRLTIDDSDPTSVSHDQSSIGNRQSSISQEAAS